MKKVKKSKKTKKKRQYPDKNLIKGALRRLFARSQIVQEVKEKARHKTKKGVRGGKVYICASCKNVFTSNKVQVDHKNPVVDLDKTIQNMDYNEIVTKIFCKKSNLQVLCTLCHKEKTKNEREERKRRRRIV